MKHPMTIGDHVCSGCGHSFCRECIVFPFGVDRPGLCIGCALERGGVRARSTDWPRLPKRTIRRRLRESRDKRSASVRTRESDPDGGQDGEGTDPAEPWLGDGRSLDDIPGAWSQVYR